MVVAAMLRGRPAREMPRIVWTPHVVAEVCVCVCV
jgi:hypothetical protein